MKIAVLVWDPVADDPSWQPNGPLLPIEFAKITSQGGLIPVLCGEPWVINVPTLWAMSTFDELGQARHDLAVKEQCSSDEEIGYSMDANGANSAQLDSLPSGPLKDEILDRLRRWRQNHDFGAVIWKDSCANIPQGQKLEDAKANAVDQLAKLPDNVKIAAETKVQQMPIQVWTIIRAHIMAQFNWVPEPATPQIKTADDPRFKEWEQCRTTIGRLDSILVDLRKAGFPLITGLLTASTFLGSLGVATGKNMLAAPSALGAVFIAIMILVAALFSIDTYYQVLISGAVSRALDLERITNPPIRITRCTSGNALESKTNYIILFLYLALLAVTGGLGLLGTLNLALWPTNVLFLIWIMAVALEVIGLILTFQPPSELLWRASNLWRMMTGQPKVPPPKQLQFLRRFLGGALVLWGIIAVPSFISAAKTSGILPWVVCCFATILALYIGTYWIYVAIKLNLNQSKERSWPRYP